MSYYLNRLQREHVVIERGSAASDEPRGIASIRVDDITVVSIAGENASHKADVVEQACDKKVGVVAGRCGCKEGAPPKYDI
jgi:hypothetical protein